MKRKNKLSLLIAFLIGLTATNCLYKTHHPSGMLAGSAIQPNLPFEELGTETAVASNYNLFWLFGVTEPPNINLAITEAINKKGGDAMIRISITKEEQYWAVGTVEVYHISGQVIRYRRPEDETKP